MKAYQTEICPQRAEVAFLKLVSSKAACLHNANGRGGFGSQSAADPMRTSENPSQSYCGHRNNTSQSAHTGSTIKASHFQHREERLPGFRKGF